MSTSKSVLVIAVALAAFGGTQCALITQIDRDKLESEGEAIGGAGGEGGEGVGGEGVGGEGVGGEGVGGAGGDGACQPVGGAGGDCG